MYGLVIESIVAYVRKVYGDEKWLEIRRLGKIDQHSFSTHLIYPETTIPRLVEVASELLGLTKDEMLVHFGNFFVEFVSQYGYDKILRVLGRHMRDFLNGLDNLHEYMRFSYPKLKPPSFFVEKENEHGLMLHYRSKRRYGGYVRYVMGQIKSVGEIFYGLDIDIELVKEEFLGNTVHVTMQLRFDNSAFLTDGHSEQDIVMEDMKIDSEMFFEAFPFHVVFTEDMTIKSVGHGLANVCPNTEGYDISHIFNLKRPMVEFTWDQVMSHTNNVFEMESVDSVQKKPDMDFLADGDNRHRYDIDDDIDRTESDITDFLSEGMKLHLKGQMMWVPEWQGMLFLGTPVLPNLTAMFDTGLFINDLSLHDNSRDLVLAGTQTSAELKLALDQEQVKSKKLEESMRKLDEEMRRTDELLYQMIPRTIADRLRAGEPALETCQVFNDVTVLFSDVVGFTMICSRISPLQVVTMLNMMYSKFDQLCSTNDVYKVETIGDAYVVVSGAPEEVTDHAERIADMAIGMLETMPTLVDPSTGAHLQIRVGLNSGVVVAGVVGLKMPRYCLFGDTVNTAAKMESSSQSMKVQMTEATMKHLTGNPKYVTSLRGLVDVKDKGKMNTYWLGKSDDYESLRIIRKIAVAPPPGRIRTTTMSRPPPPKRNSLSKSNNAEASKKPETPAAAANAASPKPVPAPSPSKAANAKEEEKHRRSSLAKSDSGYANSVKSDLPTDKDLPRDADKQKERKQTGVGNASRTPKTGANTVPPPPSAIQSQLSPNTSSKYSFPIKPRFTEPKDLSLANSDVDSASEVDSDDSRRNSRQDIKKAPTNSEKPPANQPIDRSPQTPPAKETIKKPNNSLSNGISDFPGMEALDPNFAPRRPPPTKQSSMGKRGGRKESIESMDSQNLSPFDKRPAPVFDFELHPEIPVAEKKKPPQSPAKFNNAVINTKQKETNSALKSTIKNGEPLSPQEKVSPKPAEPVQLQLSRRGVRLSEPVETTVNGVAETEKNGLERRSSENSSTESKVISRPKDELKVKPKAPLKRSPSPRLIEQSPRKTAEVEIIKQSFDAPDPALTEPAKAVVTVTTASQTSHPDLRAGLPRSATTTSIGTDAQPELLPVVKEEKTTASADKEKEALSNGNKEMNNLAVPVQPDQPSVNSFDAAVDDLISNEFHSFKGKKAAKVSINGKTGKDGSSEKINGRRDTAIGKAVVINETETQRRSIRSCACVIS